MSPKRMEITGRVTWISESVFYFSRTSVLQSKVSEARLQAVPQHPGLYNTYL